MEIIPALIMFAFVSSITPGPNNMMLLASGANHGMLRSLPHLLGVTCGFSLMLVILGVGIMQLFDAYPLSLQVLQVISAIYLLYLAYKIATSQPVDDSTAQPGKPISFVQAVLFQWVNPKAWTMAISSISIYAPSHQLSSILLVSVVFALVNLPCCTSWLMMGRQIQRMLTSASHIRIFNYSMAVLLVSSLYPALT